MCWLLCDNCKFLGFSLILPQAQECLSHSSRRPCRKTISREPCSFRLSPWAVEVHSWPGNLPLYFLKTVQGSYAITIPYDNTVILNKNWMFQHRKISHPDYKDLLEIFFISFQSLFKGSFPHPRS